MSDSDALDSFDRNILAALTTEGRLSWVDMAQRVNLSPSVCQRRVRALQERGILRGFHARIDPEALGYAVEAFVAVRVERQNVQLAEQFRAAVTRYPQVQSCHLLSGDVDFMLRVVVPDLRALAAFIQEALLNLPGIKDASSSIVLERIKDSPFAPYEPASQPKTATGKTPRPRRGSKSAARPSRS
jgi:Lrp/AsnC family transcriptional regulator, leucine-responsive regulatory protein